MIQLEFSRIVERESFPLKHYALQLTGYPDDADDLVQETMLKAYTCRDSFINNYRRMVKRNTFIDTMENTFYLDGVNHQTEHYGYQLD